MREENQTILQLKPLCLALALVSLVACTDGDQQGHRQMVALLQKLSVETSHPENYYANALRAEHFTQQVAKSQGQTDRLRLMFELGTEELNAGFSQRAIQTFGALLDSLDAFDDPAIDTEGSRYLLKRNVALAWLRLGEQENCILNHTASSCLLPIEPEGVHRLQRGSEEAINIYLELLEQNQDDLESRWLYTLAKMTLGQYEQGSSDPYLLPDSLFSMDRDDSLRFKEVGMATGIDHIGLSGGSITEDFNNDGYMDLMVSSWGLKDQIRLYESQPNGTFLDMTKVAGLNGITGGLNLVHADYNRDNFADVLVLRGAWRDDSGLLPNSLLRNNGDGTFTDVTFRAGLASLRPTQAAAWGDLNGDDLPDLFIANETYGPLAPMPCQLYLNQGDGTFKESSQAAGVDATGYFKGVACNDYDHDGRMDVFLTNLEGQDVLYRNMGSKKGIPSFQNVTEAAGLAGDFASFPCWFFDYNQDGWDDLMVFSLDFRRRNAFEDAIKDFVGIPTTADKARLYHNNGNGTFTEVAESVGLQKVLLAMGSNFGDLNNDGWPDLYIGTGTPNLNTIIPNRLFINNKGERFKDVTFPSGTGNIQKGHGVSVADLDQDGDLDIHVTMGGAVEGDTYQNLLFENELSNDNHWVKIQAPKWKTGTRLTLSVVENGTRRKIYQTLGTGGSFGGSPLLQHIGVGQAVRIDTLTIAWSSGEVQEFVDLEVNSTYQATPSQSTLIVGASEALRPFAHDKVTHDHR